MRVKGTLDNWALAQFKDRTSDAPGAVGRGVVYGTNGQTTAIVSIDKENQLVKTETGSVYKLGSPKLMFVIKHPEIMRELGF